MSRSLGREAIRSIGHGWGHPKNLSATMIAICTRKIFAVGFASILVGALALSGPAAATSIFQKGAAQYANNVSDGQFKINGTMNENGTESFRITSLSQPKSPFSMGDAPFGLSNLGDSLGDSENGDINGQKSSSNGDAFGSLTSATAGSGSSNGMAGFSSGGGGLTALNNLSPRKNSHPTDSVLTTATTNTGIADNPAGDPSAAPLPTTLSLLATGIGGLGLLGWCRKRKTRAAA
jgi:hypothetical protein